MTFLEFLRYRVSKRSHNELWGTRAHGFDRFSKRSKTGTDLREVEILLEYMKLCYFCTLSANAGGNAHGCERVRTPINVTFVTFIDFLNTSHET